MRTRGPDYALCRTVCVMQSRPYILSAGAMLLAASMSCQAQVYSVSIVTHLNISYSQYHRWSIGSGTSLFEISFERYKFTSDPKEKTHKSIAYRFGSHGGSRSSDGAVSTWSMTSGRFSSSGSHASGLLAAWRGVGEPVWLPLLLMVLLGTFAGLNVQGKRREALRRCWERLRTGVQSRPP